MASSLFPNSVSESAGQYQSNGYDSICDGDALSCGVSSNNNGARIPAATSCKQGHCWNLRSSIGSITVKQQQRRKRETGPTKITTPGTISTACFQSDNFDTADKESIGSFLESMKRFNRTANFRQSNQESSSTFEQFLVSNSGQLSGEGVLSDEYLHLSESASLLMNEDITPKIVLNDMQRYKPSKTLKEARTQDNQQLVKNRHKRLTKYIPESPGTPGWCLKMGISPTSIKADKHVDKITAARLASRLRAIDALLLTMQLKDGYGSTLPLLKREMVVQQSNLLLLQASELVKRVQQQHQTLNSRWNFRKNWAPIPPPSQNVCTALVEGGPSTPRFTAREDRWLLRHLPVTHRAVLPRLLVGGEYRDDPQLEASGLVVTRARGRRLKTCHNLRDSYNDAMGRYVYALLS